jgi:hypothetical protein
VNAGGDELGTLTGWHELFHTVFEADKHGHSTVAKAGIVYWLDDGFPLFFSFSLPL